jgi:hypothetical protein
MKIIPLILMLLGPSQVGGDMELAHQRNQIYAELLRAGFPSGGVSVRFPGPILKEGMDASAQHDALLKLSGSEGALTDLLRDSVAAPFILKVRDEKTEQATVRVIDLWFVVRGDLDAIRPREIASESSGKAVEAGNMRFENQVLKDDELKRVNRSSQEERNHSRWFVHLKGRLLDRIGFQATDEVQATRGDNSMVIAARSDPSLDPEGPLGSRWWPIEKDGTEGLKHSFRGGASYTRIDRLSEPQGSLLVEMHAAFSEPFDWFQGAPILRSKFAPIAQDQVRKLRRELLKNRQTPARPSPSGR